MAEQQTITFDFKNTYSGLPEHFFAKVSPTPVAAPSLIKLNVELSQELGLDPQSLASMEGVEVLAGNRVALGSEPLAAAYAGHQFGHFVPQLGDGRANLLGEVVDVSGRRFDIQLKGAGRTPFSRGGDGRAALGPVLREYILSECMAALGVPTTRALAVVATGETVLRERPLPGAVFTRVAASHLRVGTFQYFAARGDVEAVRTLATYTIERHYPEAAHAHKSYLALLEGVIARQARLVAQWMLLGFIHGVMNTDNTSISGETIDYGPCAFLEAYDPEQVFSSIDQQGRYAYNNQPHAMHWNLVRFAETLLPLIAEEEGSEAAGSDSAKEALESFIPQFEAARREGLLCKIGVVTEREGDVDLAEDLLQRMAKSDADFTLTFRRLCDAAEFTDEDERFTALFVNPSAFHSWAAVWRTRLLLEPASVKERAAMMRRVNPAFIPRNHLVQEAIDAAYRGDFRPFEDLLSVVLRPYEDSAGHEHYESPARPEQRVLQTFCGT